MTFKDFSIDEDLYDANPANAWDRLRADLLTFSKTGVRVDQVESLIYMTHSIERINQIPGGTIRVWYVTLSRKKAQQQREEREAEQAEIKKEKEEEERDRKYEEMQIQLDELKLRHM